MSLEEILSKHTPSPSNLLAVLHEIQNSNDSHSLSSEDLRAAADFMNLPYSYVYGVATFYSMYSLKPRGKNIIRICQSPPCHLMGSTDVSKELMKQLGIGFGETTPDGLFTLEMSSCLGVCGVAPAMMVNDEVVGNLTVERISRIIEEKRRQK